VATLMLGAGPAMAQTSSTPQSPGRPGATIGRRIQDGVRQGQITRGELRRVRARIAAVRARVRDLRADGALSPQDRAAVRRAWRQASRLVFQVRHNRIRR